MYTQNYEIEQAGGVTMNELEGVVTGHFYGSSSCTFCTPNGGNN